MKQAVSLRQTPKLGPRGEMLGAGGGFNYKTSQCTVANTNLQDLREKLP